eukprot:Gb_35033 [translate_table: standard]
MGRTTKWLKSFLRGKKEAPPPKDSTREAKADESNKTVPSEKRRWSFGKSHKNRSTQPIAEPKAPYNEDYTSEAENEQNKHAIAVAAATAAAADAAIAAAQAAAAVVRLTSSGFSFTGGANREDLAALRIQTAFRGYLAKKALCALKSLVKLQALVRGHIVRKQAASTLRCMQALVRVQARIRARRVRMSEEGQAVQRKLVERRHQESSPRKSTGGWNASTGTVEELEAKLQSRQAAAVKRERALSYALSQQEMESSSLDESAKIVEMDTSRPKLSSMRRIGSMSESVSVEPSISSTNSAAQYPPYASQSLQSSRRARSPPRHEASTSAQADSNGMTAQPARLLIVRPASDGVTASSFQDFSPETVYEECTRGEDSTFSTAQSSPQFSSAVSKIGGKQGPFTPSKSEYAESYFQGYSAFPNYMANTESSRAKVRSHSAPKQRPDPSEKNVLSSKKRMSLQGAVENRSNFGARMQRSSSQVQATRKGYQYAGPIRLDRSTMSLRDSEIDTASLVNGDF